MHKLIALAAVILTGVSAQQTGGRLGLGSRDVALLGAASLSAVIAFASGGMLSAHKSRLAAMLWAHRIAALVGSASVFALVVLWQPP